MISIGAQVLYALSYNDVDEVIASFRKREDAEFTRKLWEEYGRHTGMIITECLIDGDISLTIGEDL